MAKWLKISETRYVNEDFIIHAAINGDGTTTIVVAKGIELSSIRPADAAELVARIKASASQPSGDLPTRGSRLD